MSPLLERGTPSCLTKRPLLLVGRSDRGSLRARAGLELGSYRTGEESEPSSDSQIFNEGGFLPPTGRAHARGVASRSPTLKGCLGGELMTIPSLTSCDEEACGRRAGEDWKNRGDEDATAASLAPDLVERGVALDFAGVEDCDFRDEWPRRREDGVDDIIAGDG